ncbi:MAG: hypothetical protein LBC18_03330 [Opitutaceae bacterium]|jgi:hypothetical protein|nr:hypothetical protein [Opitutaceae bacterium]
MPTHYGLEVRSTAGTLQIYRGAFNYVFKRKVSVPQISPDSGYGHGAEYRIVPLHPTSLLAIRPPFDVSQNGTPSSQYPYCAFAVYGSGGAPFDAWEFAPVGETDEHYGIKVWDEWGDITFNSAEHTMKIAGGLNAQFADSPLHDNYAVPATAAGRTLAVVLRAAFWWHSATDDRPCNTAVRLSGASFVFNRHYQPANSTPGAEFGDPNTGYLLVDITDHL